MKIPPFKFLLAAIDFILLRISFSIALQLRGISRVHSENWVSYLLSPEFFFFFIYSFVMVLIFQYHNLYKIHVLLSRAQQLTALSAAFFYAFLGLTFLAFFIRSPWIIDSRLALTYFAVLSFSLIALYRIYIIRPLYIYVGKNGHSKRNVAIVGATIGARNLAIQFELENEYGLNLVGFIDDEFSATDRIFERCVNLGRIADIPELVRRHKIDELFIAVSDVEHHELLEIIDICKNSGAEVKVTSALFDVIERKVELEKYFDVPVVRMASTPYHGRSSHLKRLIDVVLSIIGLGLLALPMFLVAVAIRFGSKGPVLHKQVRLGKDARPFRFYKFRTMKTGSEDDQERIRRMKDFIAAGKGENQGPTKILNEERVTSIGRILRRTSFDELPQLLNVLKGDMSLVGPRPCLPYEYEAYKEWHKRRLSVFPGCTGLWQVSSRSEGGFDDMVLLDLYYIDNQSPWLDLQLILKTIPVMILGRGAK